MSKILPVKIIDFSKNANIFDILFKLLLNISGTDGFLGMNV